MELSDRQLIVMLRLSGQGPSETIGLSTDWLADGEWIRDVLVEAHR